MHNLGTAQGRVLLIANSAATADAQRALNSRGHSRLTVETAASPEGAAPLIQDTLAAQSPFALCLLDSGVLSDPRAFANTLWAIDRRLLLVAIDNTAATWIDDDRLTCPDQIVCLRRPFCHKELNSVIRVLLSQWHRCRDQARRLQQLEQESQRRRPAEMSAGDRGTAKPARAIGNPSDDRPQVLLVEDEPALRELFVLLLGEQGLKVRHVADAEAVLADPEMINDVDVLLTDVRLPGMSGIELATAIWCRRPELPTVFLSGYAHCELVQPYLSLGYCGFMQKPISATTLARLIAELTGGVAANAA